MNEPGLHATNFSFILFLTVSGNTPVCVPWCLFPCTYITPGRWQSKMPILSRNVAKKSIKTVFLIAICRPPGDKWQSKTLFLSIFYLGSSIVDNIFDCHLSGVFMPFVIIVMIIFQVWRAIPWPLIRVPCQFWLKKSILPNKMTEFSTTHL